MDHTLYNAHGKPVALGESIATGYDKNFTKYEKMPMEFKSCFSSDRIRRWLTGEIPYLVETTYITSPNDSDPDMSSYSMIASDYTSNALIEFFWLKNITEKGRDEITAAIFERIDWLTDLDDLPKNISSDAQRVCELELLLQFVRENRSYFDEMNEKGMLGFRYEEDVLPLLSVRDQ